MRFFDARAVEVVRFESDLAAIAVAVERVEDSGPVEFLVGLEEALPLGLYIARAVHGEDLVGVRIGDFLVGEGVVGVPIEADGFGQELDDAGEFRRGGDVARAFVFDDEVDFFLLGDEGHFAQNVGDALELGLRFLNALEGEDAEQVDAENVGGADALLEIFDSIVEFGLMRGEAFFALFGRFRLAAQRFGAGEGDLEERRVEERNFESVVLEFLGGGFEVFLRLLVVVALFSAWYVAELDPLEAVFVGEGDSFGG